MRRVRRGPILLVVVAALVAAVVLDQDDRSRATSGGDAGVTSADPGLPPADALSASWYCTEGTSVPGGRADETIIVSSVADEALAATVTVMPGGAAAPVSRTVNVGARSETRLRVADLVETPEPGVIVEVVGGQAVVAHEVVATDVAANGVAVGDVASEPCSRRAGTDWYFAAGTTVRGAQQFLALFNPFGDDAIVEVSFLTDTGVQEPNALQGLVVGRRSRVSVPVHDLVPRQQLVGIHVRARTGRVVAERSMRFDGTVPEDAPVREGLALSLGAASPRHAWDLPFGTTDEGGAALVGVANFGATPSTVEVQVILPGDQSLPPQSVPVPARGVVSVDVSSRVPVGERYAVRVAAGTLEGTTPDVVAEVLAWWPQDSPTTAAASTPGSPRPARRWVVALPGADVDGIVTVLNPGSKPVTAELSVYDDDGAVPASAPSAAIAPGRFETFAIGRLGAGRRQVVVVTADRPVAVGLTLVGPAGVSFMAAVPDFAFPRPV